MIGAGVAGLSAAAELGRRGVKAAGPRAGRRRRLELGAPLRRPPPQHLPLALLPAAQPDPAQRRALAHARGARRAPARVRAPRAGRDRVRDRGPADRSSGGRGRISGRDLGGPARGAIRRRRDRLRPLSAGSPSGPGRKASRETCSTPANTAARTLRRPRRVGRRGRQHRHRDSRPTGGGRRGRVRMAVRTPPNLVPIELFGIPITYVARAAELAPEPLVNLVGRGLSSYAVGDLTPYGLPPAPLGIGTELRVKGLGPVLDRGIGAALRSRPGRGGHRGRLVRGGRRQARRRAEDPPRVVIAATGYRMGLEPLVGHLGVLLPSGKPACPRGESHPASPGLHFNGYWLPMSGELPAMRRTTKRIGAEINRSRAGRADPRRAASGSAR